MSVMFRSFVFLLFSLFFVSLFTKIKSVEDHHKLIRETHDQHLSIGVENLYGLADVNPDGHVTVSSGGDNNDNDNLENRRKRRREERDKRRKERHHKKDKRRRRRRNNKNVENTVESIENVVNTLVPTKNVGTQQNLVEANGAVKPDFETNFTGSWILHSPNSGVSAMHMQLMPNNKAIWYDVTALGPSSIKLNPPYCRPVPNRPGETDCYAHGIEYDIESGDIRTLMMENNPWCSSGGLSPTGELVGTGGSDEGLRAIRIIGHCDGCEFREKRDVLSSTRWYGTQQMLEDGSFALVGGRGAHNYEILPNDKLEFPINQIGLPLLFDTEDEKENNLYPFVYLIPDGNLYIFANNKSIIINPQTGETLREFPDLPGGSRNYPSSGTSALLPLKLNDKNAVDDAEVIVCGGNTHDAFKFSENPPRKFFKAFKDCARISITKQDSEWDFEDMPSPRVMGDMLLLPNGEILIINGAKAGTSGWWAGDLPNLTPVLYSPDKPKGQRFKELAPTTIPRMYHSTSAVLPDGQILVGGSNTNSFYDFKNKYPTELRVEKFSPPYLAPEFQQYRPVIDEVGSDKIYKYGQEFRVKFKLDVAEQLDATDFKVTMYAPPFTTHGFSHNQRLIILHKTAVTDQEITAMAPPSGKIAPPGYYLLFVVYRGVPSKAMWVNISA